MIYTYIIKKIRAGSRCLGCSTRDRLPGEAEALKSETVLQERFPPRLGGPRGGCHNGPLQVHIWHIRKRHRFRYRRSMSFVLGVPFRVSLRAEFAPGVCHIGCPMCGFSMGGSGALTRRIRSWGVPECGSPRAYFARGYDGNNKISEYGG